MIAIRIPIICYILAGLSESITTQLITAKTTLSSFSFSFIYTAVIDS